MSLQFQARVSAVACGNMEISTEESSSLNEKRMKSDDDHDYDNRVNTVDDGYDSDRSMTEEEFQAYLDEVDNSDGFDVIGDYPMGSFFGMIIPVNLGPKHEWCDYNGYSRIAVDEYNRRFKGELEFVEVLKVMHQASRGIKFYITFEAKDFADGAKIKTYQAVVLSGLDDEISVFSFRLKPPEGDQGSSNNSREWFWNENSW